MKKNYVVGVDIGGTNTVFGIVDRDGNIIDIDSIKTKKHDNFDDYLKDLHSGITALLEKNNLVGEIQGIGIGAPSANYHTGRIENAANLPWGNIVPIVEKTSKIFGGLPVAVTNDANAAALGEMKYGVAKGLKDFIMITLGTGVGSGIVVNGEVVYGRDGFAGELGHAVVIRPNGRTCGCGRKGCLETYCSASGVVRTAREFLREKSESSLLRNIPEDQITSKDVYDAAKAGDKLANEIFEFTGELLGEALADFVTFSSPEAFVLFGGLAKSGDLLLDPLKKSFEKSLLFVYRQKPEILLSTLKENDAAVLGASALGWDA
ncbi:MAG: ROK family protein [Muribaculaceae bacterium]|nr:ROK family protein [Muribaculaceae bacterium]